MRNITASGLACLVVAVGLLLGHLNLSPYIERKISEGILGQVAWRPDSPPEIQGEKEASPDHFGSAYPV